MSAQIEISSRRTLVPLRPESNSTMELGIAQCPHTTALSTNRVAMGLCCSKPSARCCASATMMFEAEIKIICRSKLWLQLRYTCASTTLRCLACQASRPSRHRCESVDKITCYVPSVLFYHLSTPYLAIKSLQHQQRLLEVPLRGLIQSSHLRQQWLTLNHKPRG